MKILFLTLDDIRSIDEYGIYQDLLRSFVRRGDEVYIVSPTERRNKERSGMLEGKCKILKVRIGNTTKTNLLEKGISTLLLEPQFKGAIKRYLKDVKFDLVLYSTPPITLAGAIRYVKNRDGAKTYLMLKDIFPQNAVDMGISWVQPSPALLHSPLFPACSIPLSWLFPPVSSSSSVWRRRNKTGPY